MSSQHTATAEDSERELEVFLNDGGTLAMLRDISGDQLEQLYSLGFNQYQSGKWEEAHKVFQSLCVLNHYDPRFFLGLGACRQSMGRFEEAVQSYSYGTLLDINEPRFPFHAAECHVQMGNLAAAESGFYMAQTLAVQAEHVVLGVRAKEMLETVVAKMERNNEHDN
jgi:type III secretion system low calcium response chaperone LcrH/SycD